MENSSKSYSSYVWKKLDKVFPKSDNHFNSLYDNQEWGLELKKLLHTINNKRQILICRVRGKIELSFCFLCKKDMTKSLSCEEVIKEQAAQNVEEKYYKVMSES